MTLGQRLVLFPLLILLASCQEEFNFKIPEAAVTTVADTTAPTILSVDQPADGAYVTGDDLDFTVTFSEPVVISGNPRLSLTIGASTLYAVAVTGALSATHTFRYTLTSSEQDMDGIDHASPLQLNGGTILDAAGNASTLNFIPSYALTVKANIIQFNNVVRAVLSQSDGKVIVAGDFTDFNGLSVKRIVRLTTDLKLDPTFNSGDGFDASVMTLAFAQDGSGDFYAGGCFTTYDGSSRRGVARVNADGSLDTSFNPGIGINNDTSCGTNKRIEVIKHTNDGTSDIYLGGKFDDYNGYPVFSFVRVNADGTRDGAFDTNTKITQYSVTTDIEIPRDGSNHVLVSGDFTDFGGDTSRTKLFRIDDTGTLRGPMGTLTSSKVHNIINAPGKDQRLFIAKEGGFYGGDIGRMFRLDIDGIVDPYFAFGSDFDADPLRILQDSYSDTQIFAGGFFISGGGRNPGRIMKIEDNGSAYPPVVFPGGTGQGFDGEVLAMEQSRDGRGLFFVGGNFTTYNGDPAGNFQVIDEKNFGANPAPKIANVNISLPDNTYTVAGTTGQIRLTFSEAVDVTGFPIVILNTSTPGNVVVATYVSGTGSQSIYFDYVMGPGQTTNGFPLTYVDEHSLVLNAGSITAADTGDAVDLRLPLVGDTGSLIDNHWVIVNVP